MDGETSVSSPEFAPIQRRMRMCVELCMAEDDTHGVEQDCRDPSKAVLLDCAVSPSCHTTTGRDHKKRLCIVIGYEG